MQEIRNLLIQGELKEALEALLPFRSDAVVLLSEYNRGYQDRLRNTITYGKWSRIQSRLTQSALELVQTTPKLVSPPEIRPFQDDKKSEAKSLEAQKQKEEAQRHRALDPFHSLMVHIEGGIFDMGNNESDFEKPVHRVTVKDFSICKYPVTQAAWKKIMGEGNNPSYFKGDKLPVENVSWNEAQIFIKKLNEITGENYRLPSEAEWEYAASGGQLSKGFKYSGSNDLGEVAWFRDNSDGKMHPIGQKQANELGLHDMSGNVLEWCEDIYHYSYEDSPSDSSAWTIDGKKDYRVLRGGSWNHIENQCQVSFRKGSLLNEKKHLVEINLSEDDGVKEFWSHSGFRCARDL